MTLVGCVSTSDDQAAAELPRYWRAFGHADARPEGAMCGGGPARQGSISGCGGAVSAARAVACRWLPAAPAPPRQVWWRRVACSVDGRRSGLHAYPAPDVLGRAASSLTIGELMQLGWSGSVENSIDGSPILGTARPMARGLRFFVWFEVSCCRVSGCSSWPIRVSRR